MTSKKLRKVLLFIAKLVVSATMLWFVFSRIGIREVLELVAEANVFWLLAGTVLFVLSKWVSALRLNLFFRKGGLVLSNRMNLRLYLMGMFYNLFLPGGISGDAYKVVLLRKQGSTPTRDLVSATVLDRVTGLIALLIITALLTLLLPLEWWIKGSIAVLIPLTIVISYSVLARYFPRYTPIFVRSNLQSAAVQILQLGTAICILQALHFNGDTALLLVVFLISSVMAVIPLTFGGAGAREFTFALAGTWLAMSPEIRGVAITLGLVFYLITACVSLAGIRYLFFPIRLTDKCETSDPPKPPVDI
jgi:glycosyltransferase 2 family protein